MITTNAPKIKYLFDNQKGGIMRSHWIIILVGLLSSKLAIADDTEIYRNTENRVNPNVIFIIDTSGSMAFYPEKNERPESIEPVRLDILKNSVMNAIDILDPELPINLAIMRFDERESTRWTTDDGAQGGFVLHAFESTDNEENKERFKKKVAELDFSNIGGGTPITESIMEAYRYLTGAKPVYGAVSECTPEQGQCLQAIATSPPPSIDLDYYGRPVSRIGSVAESMENGNYISPVEYTCQQNHIVLFTDGMPTYDSQENENIRSLIANLKLPAELELNKDCDGAGGCSAELAYWIYNTDHFKDKNLIGGKNKKGIKNTIQIYTVGSFKGVQENERKLLNRIALMGNPRNSDHINADGTSRHYYNADDEEALTDALMEVFGGISISAGLFAAPTVAVNSFNSLEHREELYYAVFQPSELPGWSGNVKRYRMSPSGKILDANNRDAVSDETGYFKESAQSFWSNSIDGPSVTLGGMANQLNSARNVYTDINSSNGPIMVYDNRIHEDNKSITSDMLKKYMPARVRFTDRNRTEALQWGRGLDPRTLEPRKTLSDPMHTTPILTTYREGNTLKDVLYLGSNVGYLHAFDTSLNTPGELWAFMPKEMLPNLAVYQRGAAKFLKAYGIDGPLSIYHHDKNRDRVIDKDETVYLTAGMRRGGSDYILFDISSRANPKLIGRISAGSSGYEELGQTWSRMTPAHIIWKGKKVPVFFFGGGYDAKEDKYTVRTNHTVGNAIYVVTADSSATGKPFDLLWKATGRPTNLKGLSFNDMKSSFASDLTLIDNTGDGAIDVFYAADVGGRVWRFDISPKATTSSNFAKGGVIADFNGGNAAENIRFFTQPDAVYTEYGRIESSQSTTNKPIYDKRGRYQIALGSGFRANPLSTKVKDKIFLINDYYINSAPSNYKTLRLSDIANHSRFANESAIKRENGMYYNLPGNGEKVLSSSLTVNNIIYVPTFKPAPAKKELSCIPDAGEARLIAIKPLDNPKTTEREIESSIIKQGGIVPKPVLVFPQADPNNPNKQPDPIILIGTEIVDAVDGLRIFKKSYWKDAKEWY